MSKISDSLQLQCTQNQQHEYAVIVTLVRNSEGLQSIAIDSTKLKAIDGITGVYKAVLTGSEVLKLGESTQVEAVEPDEQFGILD